MPKSVQRCVTYMSNSSKQPSSSSRSSRSRAVSLPLACCASMRLAPPPRRASARAGLELIENVHCGIPLDLRLFVALPDPSARGNRSMTNCQQGRGNRASREPSWATPHILRHDIPAVENPRWIISREGCARVRRRAIKRRPRRAPFNVQDRKPSEVVGRTHQHVEGVVFDVEPGVVVPAGGAVVGAEPAQLAQQAYLRRHLVGDAADELIGEGVVAGVAAEIVGRDIDVRPAKSAADIWLPGAGGPMPSNLYMPLSISAFEFVSPPTSFLRSAWR